MYDLKNAIKDFPWTAVKYNAVEPWRTNDSGWFDAEIPVGWGDVTYQYLVQMDKVLKKYDIEKYLCIEQIKEKFGGGRFYFLFFDNDNIGWEPTAQEQIGIDLFTQLAWEWEDAVTEVCCDCGTTKNIKCYGGWYHFACPECEAKRVEEYKKRHAKWQEENALKEAHNRG